MHPNGFASRDFPITRKRCTWAWKPRDIERSCGKDTQLEINLCKGSSPSRKVQPRDESNTLQRTTLDDSTPVGVFFAIAMQLGFLFFASLPPCNFSIVLNSLAKVFTAQAFSTNYYQNEVGRANLSGQRFVFIQSSTSNEYKETIATSFSSC